MQWRFRSNRTQAPARLDLHESRVSWVVTIMCVVVRFRSPRFVAPGPWLLVDGREAREKALVRDMSVKVFLSVAAFWGVTGLSVSVSSGSMTIPIFTPSPRADAFLTEAH